MKIPDLLPQLTPPSILIVDDTLMNLQLAGDTLTQHISCELSFATSGAQGLATAKAFPPDLILLDIIMPDLNGLEVCHQLKLTPELSHIPVIFLTAKSESEDLVAGFEAGAADYVQKPFNPFELVTRVKNQLQLQADRIAIAKKNRELRQLLHILCHDLANPVGAINGLLHLYTRDLQVPGAALGELAGISEQALELIGLVRDLRGIEEGLYTITLRNTRLADIVEQAIRTLRPRLEEKRLTIECNVPCDLVVRVEPVSFLNSVLSNLLTNALKFSFPDSTILVRAEPVGSLVQLSITDHGIGMPMHLLERIFDPMERTTRQGTTGEIGTGFGMPLVKNFVELYGGSVFITSTAIHPEQPASAAGSSDHGTTVTILLPAAQSQEG